MTSDDMTRRRTAQKRYHPGWGQREYTGWYDEQMSWKSTCYLGDWSFLGESQIAVSGPDALALLSGLSVNSFARFEIGQGKHMVQCTEPGYVVGEGVLVRLAEDRFITQGSSARWTAYQAAVRGSDVEISHPRSFIFQVSGPQALAVVEAVTGEDLTEIRFMRTHRTTIAGVEVMLLRQGMAGEIGFEIHGPAAEGEAVRRRILDVGEGYGIRQLGSRTAMINHLEAAFPTGGWHFLNDTYSDDGYSPWAAENFGIHKLSGRTRGSLEARSMEEYLTDPYELGWGRSVKFDHDFIGREALELAQAAPGRQRVTLVWDVEDVMRVYGSHFAEGAEPLQYLDMPYQEEWAFWADAVLDDKGSTVGMSTVPGYSALFRRFLSLAYVSSEHAAPGSEVGIRWGEPGRRQTVVRAHVEAAPIKQDNRRSDLGTLRGA